MKVFEVIIRDGDSYLRKLFDADPSIQELKELLLDKDEWEGNEHTPTFQHLMSKIEARDFIRNELTVHQIR